MTLIQLEYIIALDNYRHFVTAARNCFITQPTLTMQVKKLEEEIGFKIFDRSKNPLKPTAPGEKFIAKARQILRETNQLKAMVSDEKESMEGNFTLGIIPTIAPYLLPLFLNNFIKLYPNTYLHIKELQTKDIVEQLNSDRIDLGIVATPLLERTIREIPLYYEPFHLFLSEGHALLQKKLISASDINGNELLLLTEGHCFREQALELCNLGSDISEKGYFYESESIETIKQLVKKNMGITLIPELAILNKEEAQLTRKYKTPAPTREVSIVVHNSFSREKLLDKLHESILKSIPEGLTKKHKTISVKWK
jgi:LysR family hydrogen peroxide-inducible transcriptional activator